MSKITKRSVDALQPRPDRDVFEWDTEVRGFGVRAKPSGVKTFLIQYRNIEGRTRRLVLGQYGALTPEIARQLARKKLVAVMEGADPSADRQGIRVRRSAGHHAEQAQCEALLTDISRVKIYYDSGHTLAKGRFYESGFTDQPFDWQFEPMAGYLVDEEKPLVGRKLDIPKIGQPSDDSLFGLVVKKLFPLGWLACDDGSMELADFIHIDPAQNILTLVHAKGSGSKAPTREVSVADYEIVVSQALKNLRHLHRYNLHDELTKGKGKKIGAAVWKDGVRQSNRTGFLGAAKALTASTKKVALVLQPRLTETEHSWCTSPAAKGVRSMRMKQLNTLMLAARLSAMACGANLVGIGEK
jgi:hypothetical protein